MIGVIATQAEAGVVEEFFQLFKTQWEFYVPGRAYDVIIQTSESREHLDARLVLIYGSQNRPGDGDGEVQTHHAAGKMRFIWNGFEVPVYGALLSFERRGETLLPIPGSSRNAAKTITVGGPRIVRVGYDLFHEVTALLSKGQPPENAPVPTLDLHISILRDCILKAEIPLVELRPAPQGSEFVVCLSHDVDFVGIQDHKFDRTMWGFLYRAVVGSFFALLRGRIAWRTLFRHWRAAASLPLVHCGVCRDFWLEFERYKEIERDLGSTFFFLPYKGVAGQNAPSHRAAKYDIADLRKELEDLLQAGCEVGLHGIDAWHSSELGREEMSRLREFCETDSRGLRMHWLLFDAASPKVLEDAGFNYDSTFGYNDAIGFRGGTSQVFRPPTAEKLMELPMVIQDSALFYSGRMNLAPEEALERCLGIIACVSRWGGTLTINWHTRSLSPERSWDEFYLELLSRIKGHNVWFSTASKVVEWFRARRSVEFQQVAFEGSSVRVTLSGALRPDLPPLAVRVYHPDIASSTTASGVPYQDIPWHGQPELCLTQ